MTYILYTNKKNIKLLKQSKSGSKQMSTLVKEFKWNGVDLVLNLEKIVNGNNIGDYFLILSDDTAYSTSVSFQLEDSDDIDIKIEELVYQNIPDHNIYWDYRYWEDDSGNYNVQLCGLSKIVAGQIDSNKYKKYEPVTIVPFSYLLLKETESAIPNRIIFYLEDGQLYIAVIINNTVNIALVEEVGSNTASIIDNVLININDDFKEKKYSCVSNNNKIVQYISDKKINSEYKDLSPFSKADQLKGKGKKDSSELNIRLYDKKISGSDKKHSFSFSKGDNNDVSNEDEGNEKSPKNKRMLVLVGIWIFLVIFGVIAYIILNNNQNTNSNSNAGNTSVNKQGISKTDDSVKSASSDEVKNDLTLGNRENTTQNNDSVKIQPNTGANNNVTANSNTDSVTNLSVSETDNDNVSLVNQRVENNPSQNDSGIEASTVVKIRVIDGGAGETKIDSILRELNGLGYENISKDEAFSKDYEKSEVYFKDNVTSAQKSDILSTLSAYTVSEKSLGATYPFDIEVILAE